MTKDNLSDYEGLLLEANIPTIWVKKHIQNAERRLKEEIIKFRDQGFSFRNWKIILPQVIDKIFLEEFGDKFK